MRTVSIQRRLIVAVVISQLLLAAGVVSVGVFFSERRLTNAFDFGLQGRAMSIAALVRYSEEPHPKLIFEDDMVPPPLERGQPDLYLVTHNGRLIASSASWPAEMEVPFRKGRNHASFRRNGVHYRAVLLKDIPVLDREPDVPRGDTLTVVYAAPTDRVRRDVVMAALSIAGGTFLLLVLTVTLAVWGLRRVLRPLDDLARSAADISPANWELCPGDEARRTSELAPLTAAMTSMLGSLHAAFTQQREFLANAAHELKTPVAILKSTLQALLQRERSAKDYRAGLEQALDDMQRLETLLHSMLRLARAEQWATASAGREMPAVDVSSTCRSAVDRLQALASERNVVLALEADGTMLVQADPDDLELVWSNLLENAIRFSPPGEKVRLCMKANGRRGTVEIEDRGPGIAPEELPHIFERFHRGDSSRARETGGYGLGLAISKALVEAYGGTITAENRSQNGTTMLVSLPLS